MTRNWYKPKMFMLSSLAPYVKDITCLDLTEAMLKQGKKLAKQEGIQNISFVSGNAECLPFEDETFDLVITRLARYGNP